MMRTMEFQRQRLEEEMIKAKGRIRQIRESSYPDLSALKQLQESVERNLQLIGMIDQHLQVDQRQQSK